MKVLTEDFLDAFTRADLHIGELCPNYHKICTRDMHVGIPTSIYVKLVSAFWEQYYGCKITTDGTNTYVHFRKRADFTAFLLKWS